MLGLAPCYGFANTLHVWLQRLRLAIFRQRSFTESFTLERLAVDPECPCRRGMFGGHAVVQRDRVVGVALGQYAEDLQIFQLTFG